MLAPPHVAGRNRPLGRTTRVVYPDAPSGQHANPGACSDCVRLAYDYAGRPLQRQDQRNTTDFAFDARGQLRTRTTGTARDTYYYDPLGRIHQATRGTTTDEEAVASTQRSYTGLGDLDCEVQTIRKGTPRTTDYDYDQAGNQTLLGYPDGEALTYTPTALNQVDSILRAGSPLVQYGYQGRQLHTRTTTTDAPGGATTYRQTWGYDAHRRIDALKNTRDAGEGPETVADYLFTHDLNGNPLSQIVVTGLEDFIGDDRGFQVDRLNRLVGTAYYGSGETESTTFDRVGNREAHVNRQGETTQYTLANPANEYATINGQAVQYDGTGNLSRDEDGHGYNYDEQNRLTRVFEDTNGNGAYDAGETVLANYAYDAFGRRVEFENLGAGTTTRYYHAGVSVIQERDAADELVRLHVNGAQYLDEHVATLEATGLRAGETSYYLLGGNFSVVGVGSADGSAVTRLEYSPAGDPVGPGGGLFFDADDDGDLDLADWVSLADCLGGPAAAAWSGCVVHDFTRDGAVDLADAAAFQRYFSGDGNPASVACRRAGSYAHDADGDRDVDIDDYLSYESCLSTPPGPGAPGAAAVCLAIHDFDGAGRSDGDVDLDDFGGLLNCFRGAGQTPPPECFRPAPAGVPPGSGSFALHGGMVDVLTSGRSGPDGALSLQYSRARYFDLKHGRFLQRDPKGYVDGGNLYEAFGSNPTRFTDPMGTQFYEMSDVEFMRLNSVPEEEVQEFIAGYMEGTAKLGRGFSRPFSGIYHFAARRLNDWWLESKVFWTGRIDPAIYLAPDEFPFERFLLQKKSTVEAATASGSNIVAAHLLGTTDALGTYVPFQNGLFNLVEGEDRFGDPVDPIEQLGSLVGEGVVVYGIYRVSGAVAGEPATAEVVAVTRGPAITRAAGAEVAVLRTGVTAERAAALVAEFPAVSASGELNLLNVARRGVRLTPEEATAGLRLPMIDTAPRSTAYFQDRILGDYIRYGHYRGRLGNIGTRVETLNQMTILEESGLFPQLEFKIRVHGPRGPRNIFPDVAALDGAGEPIRFIEVVKSHNPLYETQRRALIQQVYPDAPVDFVVSPP